MSTSEPSQILYCRCAYAGVIRDEVKNEVLQGLCDSGQSFEAVADLCEMSARKDPALARLAKAPNLRIAACHPRAVKWLFHAAKADLPTEPGPHIANMRDNPAQTVLRELTDPS